jgi:hypothetical protein
MKKSFAFSALFVSLSLASCGGDEGSPTAPTPTPVATSITLTMASLSLSSLATLGETSQLSVMGDVSPLGGGECGSRRIPAAATSLPPWHPATPSYPAHT